MKKIFTLILFAAGLSFAASAQNRDDRYDNQDRYPVNQNDENGSYGDRQLSKDYGYNDRRYNDRRCNDRGYNDRGYNDRGYNDRRQRNEEYRRQAEYDRRNQQWDNGNNGYGNDGYGNDRSNNGYGNNRSMQDNDQQSQQKTKAIGKGLIVGGIAAILIGAVLSHGH